MKYLTELNQVDEILKNDEKITFLSNFIALSFHAFDNLNWLGFYIYKDGVLKLGPFQGLVACEIIPLNKGVCGYAATQKKMVNVKNVHEFPGHIACDSNSKSELVIPIIVDEKLLGVLDIDSPVYERFDYDIEEFFIESIKHLEIKLTSLHSTSLL